MIDMAQADRTLRQTNCTSVESKLYKVILNGKILKDSLKYRDAVKIVCSDQYWNTDAHIRSQTL